MSVEAALAICRFGVDATAMLLWGAFSYLAVLAPPDLRGALLARFDAFRTAAVLVSAAASAALLPVEAASVGDGWPDALDPVTLAAVLGGTDVGRALAIRLAVALGLVATLAVARSRAAPATALLSGALLATLALTGHAVMHEGALGLVHGLNDVAHVLAAGAWVGALLPLLPTLRAVDDQDLHASAVTALRRFSTAGHAAVALALATGTANAALVLGRWPTDPSSPYQAMLLAKVALVGTMVVLALVNRYVLVPRMGRGAATARGALRRITAVEVGLGLAAVACVSVFGLLDPS